MYRTASRVALAVALAILPRQVHAQRVADLEHQVQVLEQKVAAAKSEDDSLRAVEAEQFMARFIRVQAGGLEILTLPALRDRVDEAGQMAWEVLSLTYEDSIAAVLRGFPLSVLAKPPQDSIAARVWYPPGTTLVFAADEDPIRGLATGLLAQINQWLWLRQDPGLRDWLKSPPPIITDLSGTFAAAYLDLATSAAPVAQKCLTTASACREALGLVRPADPAADWYSPPGRRQLVIQLGQVFQVGESRQPYDRCLTGSDPDCLVLLRSVPDLIPGILLPPTRATFLRVALNHGGANSYPTLLATRDQPMEARFRQASGMDSDELVEEWHRLVIAARPLPTTMRPGQAFAAAGWTLLLLTVALRSSRWR